MVFAPTSGVLRLRPIFTLFVGLVLLGLSFLSASFCKAETPAGSSAPAKEAPAGRSKTNIYEAEPKNSITARVRLIKDSRDDTLVYFEGLKKSGPYTLSGATAKDYTRLRNRLAKSAERGGGPVTVTLDDQDYILTVEEGDSTAKDSANKDTSSKESSSKDKSSKENPGH